MESISNLKLYKFIATITTTIYIFFRIKTSNLKPLSELPSISSQLKDEIKTIVEQRRINGLQRNRRPEQKKNRPQSSSTSSDSSDDNK